MSKTLSILKDFILYVVILATILFGVPRFLSWYLETPYPIAAITSGSMWPELREGDFIFIQGNIEKSELGIGDVIVYRNKDGSTFTIHRIVALGDDTLTTKGDANFDPDSPIEYEQVVGRTFNIFGKPLNIPYLGSITVAAS